MSDPAHDQSTSQSTGRTPPRRGIYLLPNILTTLALCLGFYAIIAVTNGHYEKAAIAIIFATILDGLDGRIARLTNTQSEFGGAYDSLSDMVSFGVAPGLMIYGWALSPFGKIGWIVAFIYTAAVALRLARFHTQTPSDRRFFLGLPCPTAATMLAAIVWWSDLASVTSQWYGLLVLIAACLLALLMVSSIRYYSFKEINFRGKVSSLYAIGIIVLIGFTLANPPTMIALAGSIYIVSGILLALWKKRFFRHRS